MKNELLFENLLEKVLSFWPERLEAKLLTNEFDSVEQTDKGYEIVKFNHLPWDGKREGYIVDGLFDKEEEIYDRLEKEAYAEILTSMSRAVGIVSHELSYYVEDFDLSQLRHESIKYYFEDHLRYILADNEARRYRTKEDISSILEYFKVNNVPLPEELEKP